MSSLQLLYVYDTISCSKFEGVNFFFLGGGEGYCINKLFLLKSTRMYVNFLFLSTLNDTTMNFTLPLINEWIQAKRCPILWTKFIFKTICFGLRNCNVNAKDKKDVYLSYIATRCLFVLYLLRNGWTDLAKLFFVSSVLVTRWFQAQKIPDPVSGFSGNPEKPSFQGNIEPIWLKFSGNTHLDPNMF